MKGKPPSIALVLAGKPVRSHGPDDEAEASDKPSREAITAAVDAVVEAFQPDDPAAAKAALLAFASSICSEDYVSDEEQDEDA